jgi:hypothetical protein
MEMLRWLKIIYHLWSNLSRRSTHFWGLSILLEQLSIFGACGQHPTAVNVSIGVAASAAARQQQPFDANVLLGSAAAEQEAIAATVSLVATTLEYMAMAIEEMMKCKMTMSKFWTISAIN